MYFTCTTHIYTRNYIIFSASDSSCSKSSWRRTTLLFTIYYRSINARPMRLCQPRSLTTLNAKVYIKCLVCGPVITSSIHTVYRDDDAWMWNASRLYWFRASECAQRVGAIATWASATYTCVVGASLIQCRILRPNCMRHMQFRLSEPRTWTARARWHTRQHRITVCASSKEDSRMQYTRLLLVL